MCDKCSIDYNQTINDAQIDKLKSCLKHTIDKIAGNEFSPYIEYNNGNEPYEFHCIDFGVGETQSVLSINECIDKFYQYKDKMQKENCSTAKDAKGGFKQG